MAFHLVVSRSVCVLRMLLLFQTTDPRKGYSLLLVVRDSEGMRLRLLG